MSTTDEDPRLKVIDLLQASDDIADVDWWHTSCGKSIEADVTLDRGRGMIHVSITNPEEP